MTYSRTRLLYGLIVGFSALALVATVGYHDNQPLDQVIIVAPDNTPTTPSEVTHAVTGIQSIGLPSFVAPLSATSHALPTAPGGLNLATMEHVPLPVAGFAQFIIMAPTETTGASFHPFAAASPAATLASPQIGVTPLTGQETVRVVAVIGGQHTVAQTPIGIANPSEVANLASGGNPVAGQPQSQTVARVHYLAPGEAPPPGAIPLNMATAVAEVEPDHFTYTR